MGTVKISVVVNANGSISAIEDGNSVVAISNVKTDGEQVSFTIKVEV